MDIKQDNGNINKKGKIKMKILIINQHAGNHGDEAAGKGLLRNILKIKGLKVEDITILYNSPSVNEKEILDSRSVNIAGRLKMSFLEKILLILTFILPFCIVKFIIKNFTNGILKKELELILNNSKIINAPGGINIGPYKDWRYLWRLYVSIKLKKDVAIYSISFGPLPDNFLFRIVSLYVLKNVQFLSLRDSKSHEFASKLNIPFIKSIDSAFLDEKVDIEIPKEINELIKKEYVVVVPNQLYQWHPHFKKYSEKEFDNIYTSIIDFFIDKNMNIILLPQLYGSQNDSSYFKRFIQNKSIVIIDENYSSDIQQYIVKNASFLVGARYHSIIFSINNKVPFLSLAYEHKMTNTLELLNLTHYSLDLHEILANQDILIRKINKIFTKKNDINIDNSSAKKIAQNTFENLKEKFLSDMDND